MFYTLITTFLFVFKPLALNMSYECGQWWRVTTSMYIYLSTVLKYEYLNLMLVYVREKCTFYSMTCM